MVSFILLTVKWVVKDSHMFGQEVYASVYEGLEPDLIGLC